MPAALYEMQEKLVLLPPGVASTFHESIHSSDAYTNDRPPRFNLDESTSFIVKALRDTY